MISDRPYRKALPISAAQEEIRRFSGTQFDPQVVKVFLEQPEQLWRELHTKSGDPFLLAQLETV
jgi:HD-GYP domain-containing protein (c-di-GMP phosphodiesterase class II)